MNDDKATAILGAIFILTVAVVWAGYELYKLNAAIGPVANSPLVGAIAGIGRA